MLTHSTYSYGLGRMAGYAIELYKRIEAETRQSVTVVTSLPRKPEFKSGSGFI